MCDVRFYETGEVGDVLLKFAVIVSRYKGQWVFCRQKGRDTWEVPGGHREIGESVLEAARRELYEETGATAYELTPICPYSVESGTRSYGMLFFADIQELGSLPELEIEETTLVDGLPEQLTYPLIQPQLLERAKAAVGIG